MLKPVYRTASFLCQLVACLPIGTSLGIVHLLWAVLSGGLLPSRGAVFPALTQTGLSDTETRRAEAALREGKHYSSPAGKALPALTITRSFAPGCMMPLVSRTGFSLTPP